MQYARACQETPSRMFSVIFAIVFRVGSATRSWWRWPGGENVAVLGNETKDEHHYT